MRRQNRYQHTVTVVMPALNEEENLAAAVHNVLESFDDLGICGELIIVNDGSSDTTGEIAEKLRADNSNIAVIHHESSRGFGAAFWAGVRKASGEAVVMLPGDGENDAQEILKHLPLLEKVDVVVPYVINPEVRSIKRRFISRLFSLILNSTFGQSLRYYNGTVLYRKEILRGVALQSRGFFYQAELLIKILCNSASHAEVPCLLKTRGAGKSKALTWHSFAMVVFAYFMMIAEVYLSVRRKVPQQVKQ